MRLCRSAASLALALLVVPFAPRSVEAKPKVDRAAIDVVVKAVAKAKSDSARTKAVENLLGLAEIPVIKGKGGKLLAGPKPRGVRSLYIYDVEAQVIAAQVGKKQRYSFDAISAALADQGVTASAGGAVPAAALAAAVKAATNGIAKNKNRGAATYAAIVQALGKDRKSDLGKSVATNAAVLDPIQRTLILAGVLAPYLDSGVAARAVLPGRSAPLANRQSVCDSESSQGGTASGIAAARYLAGFGFPPMAIVAAVLDIIHGTILAGSFDVKTVSATPVNGKFGQNGPGSAEEMKFQVEVDMRDQLPQSVIDCAWLAGYSIPGQGPMQGARIGWYDLDYLKQLGTVSCPTSTCQQTDKDGIATLTFKPDDEELPGKGEGRVAHGFVSADAFVQQANNNASGTVSEAIGLRKGQTLGWEVSWHQPRGYAIDVPGFSVTRPCGEGSPDTCTYAYTFAKQRQCFASYDQPFNHPTRHAPGLGLVAASGLSDLGSMHTDVTYPDGSGVEDASFAVAIDNPGGALSKRQWDVEGSSETGTWLFDAAHTTLTAEVKFEDPTASPGSTTLPNITAHEATDCPPVPSYPQQG